ncbi:MAG: hypothetical protein QGH60_02355 [Phycisphaerae bacterium]|jgi:hypothetical protein|nr:hypothetical protein [Phycisphaerae bacterium]
MDGRVQLPVIAFLTQRFAVEYVDMITEPGPNRILGRQTSDTLIESILDKIRISVEHHHSVGIAIAGHHDCAGNPAEKAEQLADTIAAVEYIREQCPQYEDLDIIGLWVDENWSVSEIPPC